jgi:hypothetical protein
MDEEIENNQLQTKNSDNKHKNEENKLIKMKYYEIYDYEDTLLNSLKQENDAIFSETDDLHEKRRKVNLEIEFCNARIEYLKQKINGFDEVKKIIDRLFFLKSHNLLDAPFCDRLRAFLKESAASRSYYTTSYFDNDEYHAILRIYPYIESYKPTNKTLTEKEIEQIKRKFISDTRTSIPSIPNTDSDEVREVFFEYIF